MTETVTVSEQRRGCGFRKLNGLYLCTDGLAFTCDRLPFELKVCPTCGEGYKPFLGFRWIDAKKLFGGEHHTDKYRSDLVGTLCGDYDPICVNLPEKAGLMWTGSKFYSPQSFAEEATKLGVSKRISHVPRDLELGKTWILLAHREAIVIKGVDKEIARTDEGTLYKSIDYMEPIKKPGIFYAFKPTRIEKLVDKNTITNDEILKLEKKSITPILVDGTGPKYHGTVYEDKRAEEKAKKLESKQLEEYG